MVQRTSLGEGDGGAEGYIHIREFSTSFVFFSVLWIRINMMRIRIWICGSLSGIMDPDPALDPALSERFLRVLFPL